MNLSYLARQETDQLLLGYRVAWAIFAENEPYPKGREPSRHLQAKRQYATIRTRALQAKALQATGKRSSGNMLTVQPLK